MTVFIVGLLCGLALMGAAVLVLASVMLSAQRSRLEERTPSRAPPAWAVARGRWDAPEK